ncbi:MAG TPA: hypothetical protein VFY93_03330 [Planctomycetota bacterium]|nr:hypothetical protein [Planctomycetota bacterium]
MRVVATLLGAGAILALGAATLQVALPPNEAPADGPADRFLAVRRPVLRVLTAVGLVDERAARRYLPSVDDQTTTEHRRTGEILPVCTRTLAREPVYRGALLPVGRRVTYRLAYFREHDEDWRSVRLCYAAHGKRVVAAESPAPEPSVADVSGFVPDASDGFWIEFTNGNGEVHGLDGWGRIDPFWPDPWIR